MLKYLLRGIENRKTKDETEEYKVVVFGTGGVGKSSLTGQFVSETWTDRYDPTIEDAFRKEVTVDGLQRVLNILDTSGIEQFTNMRGHYMRNSQGFILVYDITNPASVDDIVELHSEILRERSATTDGDIQTHMKPSTKVIPLVLVGNKIDLGAERKVSYKKGNTLSREWKCPFHETSAKHRINVDVVFEDVVRQITAEKEAASPNEVANDAGSDIWAILGCCLYHED